MNDPISSILVILDLRTGSEIISRLSASDSRQSRGHAAGWGNLLSAS